MDEPGADGGVHDSVDAAARTALTVAMQLGQRMARLREEALAEATHRDEALARELQARFDGERAAAVAQLEVVTRPEWWAQADTGQIARLAETAQTWQGFEPRAGAALETIGQQVQDRHGIDLLELAATERAKAARDRAEAGVLVAEADLLDRAAGPAGRHVRDAADLDAGGADREAAGFGYDSAERRNAFAAELQRAGISGEDLAVRLRADTNQARPAVEAAAASPSRRSGSRGPLGPSRGREREDRSR